MNTWRYYGSDKSMNIFRVSGGNLCDENKVLMAN